MREKSMKNDTEQLQLSWEGRFHALDTNITKKRRCGETFHNKNRER